MAARTRELQWSIANQEHLIDAVSQLRWKVEEPERGTDRCLFVSPREVKLWMLEFTVKSWTSSLSFLRCSELIQRDASVPVISVEVRSSAVNHSSLLPPSCDTMLVGRCVSYGEKSFGRGED